MSSKPKKQRPSAQEKALAQVAMKKDQRYEQAFRPLEQEAIAELTTADAGKRSEMMAGRSNADLEMQAANAKSAGLQADIKAGTFGSGATTARGLRHAAAAESGKNTLKVAADQQARDSIDQDTLNVIKTGQNMSRQSQSALTSSARLANSEAASKINAEFMKDSARSAALMQVGTAAAIKGWDTYDNALGAKKADGTYLKNEEQLNWMEKGLRNKFGAKPSGGAGGGLRQSTPIPMR